MGSKYVVRTNEDRVFPLKTIGYTDYYTDSVFEFIRLLIVKRKVILYAVKHYY